LKWPNLVIQVRQCTLINVDRGRVRKFKMNLFLFFGGQDWTCMGQNRCKNQFLIFFSNTKRVPRGAQKCLKSAQIRSKVDSRWEFLVILLVATMFMILGTKNIFVILKRISSNRQGSNHEVPDEERRC
jgi:hypothetical protein